MNKPTVVLTRRWPQAVEQALMTRYELLCNEADVPLDSAALAHALEHADAVCPTVTDRLDAAVFTAARPRARLLANFGVGINHIDLDAARTHGIAVTNTPGVLTDATADLTMALLLMVARRLGEGEREVRAGTWSGWRPTHLLGRDVSGRTLGIIGFGRIGQAVARRAYGGFGMRVLVYAPRSPTPADLEFCAGQACGSLEELLVAADFVSLHCPGGVANRHLIDAECLAKLQPHACLINTARGDVVDEQALIEALASGRLAAAGLDVYTDEPAVPEALRRLDNVVLLPHLGSATAQTRDAMGRRAMMNLDAFFAGQPLPDRVN